MVKSITGREQRSQPAAKPCCRLSDLRPPQLSYLPPPLTTLSARGGKMICHARDNSTSYTHRPARSRHRSPGWSASVQSGVRRNRGSAAKADRVQVPVDITGTGTIHRRSTDGLRSVPHRTGARTMTLLEACWQMTSPRGRVLTCGVFRTIAGLEVRCGYQRTFVSIAVRARSRNRSRDCRRLKGGCAREGLFGSKELTVKRKTART